LGETSPYPLYRYNPNDNGDYNPYDVFGIRSVHMI
jgi:hypothetical protein